MTLLSAGTWSATLQKDCQVPTYHVSCGCRPEPGHEHQRPGHENHWWHCLWLRVWQRLWGTGAVPSGTQTISTASASRLLVKRPCTLAVWRAWSGVLHHPSQRYVCGCSGGTWRQGSGGCQRRALQLSRTQQQHTACLLNTSGPWGLHMNVTACEWSLRSEATL